MEQFSPKSEGLWLLQYQYILYDGTDFLHVGICMLPLHTQPNIPFVFNGKVDLQEKRIRY